MRGKFSIEDADFGSTMFLFLERFVRNLKLDSEIIYDNARVMGVRSGADVLSYLCYTTEFLTDLADGGITFFCKIFIEKPMH